MVLWLFGVIGFCLGFPSPVSGYGAGFAGMTMGVRGWRMRPSLCEGSLRFLRSPSPGRSRTAPTGRGRCSWTVPAGKDALLARCATQDRCAALRELGLPRFGTDPPGLATEFRSVEGRHQLTRRRRDKTPFNSPFEKGEGELVMSVFAFMSSRFLPVAAWVGGLHTSAQHCVDPSIICCFYNSCRWVSSVF